MRPVAVAHGRNDPMATNAPPIRITAAGMFSEFVLAAKGGR